VGKSTTALAISAKPADAAASLSLGRDPNREICHADADASGGILQ
jgi:hypothetical protein